MDRDAFREHAQAGRPVPLVREQLADLDTPLATFLKVDDGSTSFLFESVEGGERWSRYSIIGVGARARFRARAGVVEIERNGETRRVQLPADRSVDPLDTLRELREELRPAIPPDVPAFASGAIGYLSYDWVRYVEKLPDANPDTLELPDCFFVFPEIVLVHDRQQHRLSIVTLVDVAPGCDLDRAYDDGVARLDAVTAKLALGQPAPPDPVWDSAPLELEANMSREEYHQMVARSREYIQAGDIFEVVPSQRFSLPLRVDPVDIYRSLRVINPSPYLFFLRADDHLVVGSSPEVLVRLSDGEVVLRPIAGTYPRGESEEEDRALETRLLADPKELAEHLMLVDLGRNDVGRVAEIGSVHVDEFQVIERYSHVMHIVSNVRAKLRAGLDAIDLLRATFPAGTLSGAPKVRAMEIIDELEPERRGLYGGGVGYIDDRGNMDMCIAIRTLVIKGDRIYAQAGGGVVADSEPAREYEETLHKARAVLKAIERAGGGTVA